MCRSGRSGTTRLHRRELPIPSRRVSGTSSTTHGMMTTTVRNALTAIALVFFGGFAMHDLMRHDTHSTLQDVFVGLMICAIILRVHRHLRNLQAPAAKP